MSIGKREALQKQHMQLHSALPGLALCLVLWKVLCEAFLLTWLPFLWFGLCLHSADSLSSSSCPVESGELD